MDKYPAIILNAVKKTFRPLVMSEEKQETPEATDAVAEPVAEDAEKDVNQSNEAETQHKKHKKGKKEAKHAENPESHEGDAPKEDGGLLTTTDIIKDTLTGSQEGTQEDAPVDNPEEPVKKDAEGQTQADSEPQKEEPPTEEEHHKEKSKSSDSSTSSSDSEDEENPPQALAEVPEKGEDEDYAPREPESPSPSQEPKQPKRPRPALRAPPPEPAPTQNYSDEELKKMVDKMLKTQKSPDIEAIPAMKQYVEGQMRDAALGQRYEYGAKMELADEMMDKFLLFDDSEIQREKKRKEAEDKLLETKGRLIEVNKEWDEKISKWRSDQSQRVNELEAEHNAQIEEFEKRWADPNYLTQFNKPSQQLLNLRQVEQTLAMSKLFERAQQTKIRADKLQKEEVAEAQKRAVAVMRNEFDTMEAKQKREMECLLQYTKRNVEFMEQERARQVRPLEHIIERLTPLAYPKRLRDRTKQLYQEKPQQITPRPIRNVQSARTMKHAHGLSIPGINMRQYIKTKKGLTQNSQTVKRAE